MNDTTLLKRTVDELALRGILIQFEVTPFLSKVVRCFLFCFVCNRYVPLTLTIRLCSVIASILRVTLTGKTILIHFSWWQQLLLTLDIDMVFLLLFYNFSLLISRDHTVSQWRFLFASLRLTTFLYSALHDGKAVMSNEDNWLNIFDFFITV